MAGLAGRREVSVPALETAEASDVSALVSDLDLDLIVPGDILALPNVKVLVRLAEEIISKTLRIVSAHLLIDRPDLYSFEAYAKAPPPPLPPVSYSPEQMFYCQIKFLPESAYPKEISYREFARQVIIGTGEGKISRAEFLEWAEAETGARMVTAPAVAGAGAPPVGTAMPRTGPLFYDMKFPADDLLSLLLLAQDCNDLSAFEMGSSRSGTKRALYIESLIKKVLERLQQFREDASEVIPSFLLPMDELIGQKSMASEASEAQEASHAVLKLIALKKADLIELAISAATFISTVVTARRSYQVKYYNLGPSDGDEDSKEAVISFLASFYRAQMQLIATLYEMVNTFEYLLKHPLVQDYAVQALAKYKGKFLFGSHQRAYEELTSLAGIDRAFIDAVREQLASMLDVLPDPNTITLTELVEPDDVSENYFSALNKYLGRCADFAPAGEKEIAFKTLIHQAISELTPKAKDLLFVFTSGQEQVSSYLEKCFKPLLGYVGEHELSEASTKNFIEVCGVLGIKLDAEGQFVAPDAAVLKAILRGHPLTPTPLAVRRIGRAYAAGKSYLSVDFVGRTVEVISPKGKGRNLRLYNLYSCPIVKTFNANRDEGITSYIEGYRELVKLVFTQLIAKLKETARVHSLSSFVAEIEKKLKKIKLSDLEYELAKTLDELVKYPQFALVTKWFLNCLHVLGFNFSFGDPVIDRIVPSEKLQKLDLLVQDLLIPLSDDPERLAAIQASLVQLRRDQDLYKFAKEVLSKLPDMLRPLFQLRLERECDISLHPGVASLWEMLRLLVQDLLIRLRDHPESFTAVQAGLAQFAEDQDVIKLIRAVLPKLPHELRRLFRLRLEKECALQVIWKTPFVVKFNESEPVRPDPEVRWDKGGRPCLARLKRHAYTQNDYHWLLLLQERLAVLGLEPSAVEVDPAPSAAGAGAPTKRPLLRLAVPMGVAAGAGAGPSAAVAFAAAGVAPGRAASESPVSVAGL